MLFSTLMSFAPVSVFAIESGGVSADQVAQSARSHSGNTSSLNSQSESSVSAQTYPLKVRRRVAPNIVWNGPTQGLETAIAVRCAPSGMLLSASIIGTSGNDEWDKAALRAVERSDPMPLDTDGVAPPEFEMRLRPRER